MTAQPDPNPAAEQKPNDSKLEVMERDIHYHRQQVLTFKPKDSGPLPDVQTLSINFVRGREELTLRIFRPNKNADNYPTLFYIPGTAFVAKETKFTELFARQIVDTTGYQVIALDHRLAPEHTPEEIYSDVLELCKASYISPEFKVDIRNVSLGGYSSGGNLAVRLALDLRKSNFALHELVLICPLLDLTGYDKLSENSNPIYLEKQNQDKVIPESFIRWFLNLYMPESNSRQDPRYSPLKLSDAELQQLPAVSMVTGDHDRFRGQFNAFSGRLLKLGHAVSTRCIEGEDHGWPWTKVGLEKDEVGIVKGFLGEMQKQYRDHKVADRTIWPTFFISNAKDGVRVDNKPQKQLVTLS